ncbi:MAG: hypothetical protein ACO1TE_19690 [Prosthecobacter sp.]
MKAWLFLLSLLLVSTAGLSHAAEDGPLYFATPEASVDQITALLKAKDWKQLARHYDLSGSKLTHAEIAREDYFQPKTPGGGMPDFAEKKPFPIGFKFIEVEKTPDAAVVQVNVGIEIDQGGGPKQRARSSFRLRQSAAGWQLLP